MQWGGGAARLAEHGAAHSQRPALQHDSFSGLTSGNRRHAAAFDIDFRPDGGERHLRLAPDQDAGEAQRSPEDGDSDARALYGEIAQFERVAVAGDDRRVRVEWTRE